jgi:hypothetical protein
VTEQNLNESEEKVPVSESGKHHVNSSLMQFISNMKNTSMHTSICANQNEEDTKLDKMMSDGIGVKDI